MARSLRRKTVKVTKFDKKTGDAREVEVVMRDAGAANRSLELLGREFNMFVDRKEIGEPGEKIVKLRVVIENDPDAGTGS